MLPILTMLIMYVVYYDRNIEEVGLVLNVLLGGSREVKSGAKAAAYFEAAAPPTPRAASAAAGILP